jgi:hypothetical protein
MSARSKKKQNFSNNKNTNALSLPRKVTTGAQRRREHVRDETKKKTQNEKFKKKES